MPESPGIVGNSQPSCQCSPKCEYTFMYMHVWKLKYILKKVKLSKSVIFILQSEA